MGNVFDTNHSVAMGHVQTQQLKGWMLGKARLLVVLLSGAMLFMGVTMLMGNLHFALSMTFLMSLVSVLPVALVAGFLAVVIEGGTVFAANLLRETLDTVRKELDALDKVKGKFTVAEVAARKKQVGRKRMMPVCLLGICVTFSTVGAEIFWQELMQGQPWYYHIIGGVLALVCSTLLIFFELNEDMIERIIERSISSSALIGLALDQSARSQIYEEVFESQQRYIRTPEVKDSIDAANQRRLHGVLAQTVSTHGVSVTAEQLARDIRRTREERSAAEAYLTTKDENVLQLPSGAPAAEPVSIKRKSKKRIAAEKLIAKYGLDRIAADLPAYASEVGMDERTLQRHLNDIAQGA